MDALEAGVLPLQLAQSLGVIGLHAAELVAPPVVGLLGNFEVAGHLGELLAFSKHPVGFTELADDLLGCVSSSGHRDDPPFAHHHGHWALITGGPISGGQATGDGEFALRRATPSLLSHRSPLQTHRLEKERVRRQELIKRDEQLNTPSVRRFN